jgi:predicted RNA-binding Zn-ribbon protein involved in translation (DUF1610 family)
MTWFCYKIEDIHHSSSSKAEWFEKKGCTKENAWVVDLDSKPSYDASWTSTGTVNVSYSWELQSFRSFLDNPAHSAVCLCPTAGLVALPRVQIPVTSRFPCPFCGEAIGWRRQDVQVKMKCHQYSRAGQLWSNKRVSHQPSKRQLCGVLVSQV